jgi:hypothetical protein
MSAAPKPYRAEMVRNRAFEAGSLVGSYFHSGYERGWQGIAVAEPAPRVYLVATFGWLVPDSSHQCLVPLGMMMAEGWRFCGDAEWMSRSYADEVKGLWDEGRQMARGGPEDLDGPPLRIMTGAEFLFDGDDKPS